MSAESFLDRYSLPCIARLMAQKTMSSIDSSKKAVQSTTTSDSTPTNCSDELKSSTLDSNNNCGELFLLYRHLKNYKVYHAVNAKSSSNSRKKGIKIPQDFTGELETMSTIRITATFLSSRTSHIMFFEEIKCVMKVA